MTNVELLQEKLNNSGYKMTFVAKELGITYQALLNKLNNKSQFKVDEAKTLGILLHLTGAEVDRIFFA